MLGCVEEGSILVVDLQTDLISGAEFSYVESRLEPHAGGSVDQTTHGAPASTDYFTAQRVALFENIQPGRYLLTVDLVRSTGVVAVTRTVDILLDGNFSLSVIATRSCENVECGDTQTCASGRCVDPRCSPSTPELCPEPVCTAPSDCPAPIAECAEAACVAGECLTVERADSMCSASQYCHPETMCVEYPELPDAGPTDGGMPDATVPDEVPPPPRLVLPVRGAHIGVVSQGASPPVIVSTTGRPKFFWNNITDATTFMLQVDDDPAFGSPEIDVVDWGLAVYETPDAESLSPGRYFWHVAGCNAAGCSTFSGASYFRTGRVREDIDGSLDGVGAVIIGAPTSGIDISGMSSLHRGEVLTYQYSTTSSSFGAATGIQVIDANGATESELGSSLAVGNFDGGDTLQLAAGASKRNNRSGVALIVEGDSDPAPQQLVGPDGSLVEALFGSSIAVPGDINGDGFDDLVVAQVPVSTRRGRVTVYWGSMTGLSDEASQNTVLESPNPPDDGFGVAVGGVGDVNGDGFVDFAVGAPRLDSGVGDVGAVFVYFGGPRAEQGTELEDTRVMLQEPEPMIDAEFGSAIAGVDVDHDGINDLLIGAPGQPATRGHGAVFLYFGGVDGVALVAPVQIDPPVPSGASRFGDAIAGGGDVDGDGFADFVIAAPIHARPAGGTGRVWLYRPNTLDRTRPMLLPTPDELLPSAMNPGRGYGTCVALSVDRTGDGHADVIVGAPAGINLDDPINNPTGFVDVFFGVPGAGDPLAIGETIYGIGSTGEYWFVTNFGATCR